MNDTASGYTVAMQKLTDRLVSSYGEGYEIERDVLGCLGVRMVVVDARTEDRYVEAAKDADAVIAFGSGLPITRRIIEAMPRCKVIAVPAIGYDHVDVPAATDRGIVVTNVPDVFVEEVADHTLTLLLSCWRRLTVQDRMVRTGRWLEARPMLYQFPRLRGMILGFVAFGNIPRLVSRRAKVFGLRMMAYDPGISEMVMNDYEVEPVTDLSELLRCADFLSVHLPLTTETFQMISEEQFRRMKSTAIFINTGRGPTVDEAALIAALQNGWIAGAGLDVFEKEPVGLDNPLLKMENVILTAHVASASSRMAPETRRRAAQEVVRVLKGGRPIHPVNRVASG
jgi:D-3-phosphoglycerate dehydrogenase